METPDAPGDLARFIDHALLRADATAVEIERLCEEALRFRFAAVCVNGTWVRLCAGLLTNTEVQVCCVVGFPLGAMATEIKVDETRRAIADGASEIDMVMNIGALKGGDTTAVGLDIAAVAKVCRDRGAKLKVILETALLSDEEKESACVIARDAGADFVKTSTGFAKSGATVADVALMRRAVGPQLGVKAAGGVRDAACAREMLRAGATRIGSSASIAIVGGVASY